jgi:hypothetical protein
LLPSKLAKAVSLLVNKQAVVTAPAAAGSACMMAMAEWNHSVLVSRQQEFPLGTVANVMRVHIRRGRKALRVAVWTADGGRAYALGEPAPSARALDLPRQLAVGRTVGAAIGQHPTFQTFTHERQNTLGTTGPREVYLP